MPETEIASELALEEGDARLLGVALAQLHGKILNSLASQAEAGKPLGKFVKSRERSLRLADAIGFPIDDREDMRQIEAAMRRTIARQATRGMAA
jgi:hypothetical protein